MTFKHIKFEDSSTMRSLEKVARDKGWISNTPISKIASISKVDLSISTNLTENIMKLCAGLRSSGLDKYANEVESKFMNYKKAQTLYETSKEVGEDLIDNAHPKGSHKLSGIEGDNIIETIIDQHLATIKLTEKKPTGKLSSQDILRSVKIVLSQAASNPTIVQALTSALNAMKTIFSLHSEQSFLTRPIAWGEDTLIENINYALNNTHDVNVLERIYPKIKLGVDNFYLAYKPGTVIGGSSAEVWAGMLPLFNKVYAALTTIKQTMENSNSKIQPKTSVDVLTQWLHNANSTLKGFQAKISTDPDLTESEKQEASTWIVKKMNNVANVESQFQSMDDDEKIQNAELLLSNLKKITTPSFGQFKKAWID